MNNNDNAIAQLAIIGPTASGKTALSIALAQSMDAYILSLDSLAIYHEIDIASAKPSLSERAGIPHYGIDHLMPNDSFDVTTYVDLYRSVYSRASDEGKNLIIVGGTSFYLKVLLDGISALPAITPATRDEAKKLLGDPVAAYRLLHDIDPDYMAPIASADMYRIEKALHIYLETDRIPSLYFKDNPPSPIISEPLPIYEVSVDKLLLRDRIRLRTDSMLDSGLVDEVCCLESRYTRAPNCMKAIGIAETLHYLDGYLDKVQLADKITINTARLAKRQMTFNRSQFNMVISAPAEYLHDRILKDYASQL